MVTATHAPFEKVNYRLPSFIIFTSHRIVSQEVRILPGPICRRCPYLPGAAKYVEKALRCLQGKRCAARVSTAPARQPTAAPGRVPERPNRPSRNLRWRWETSA